MVFRDDRGKGEYDIFPLSKGQINITTTFPGVVRAFHCHRKQYDYWKVVSGHIQVCLSGNNSTWQVYLSEDDPVYAIPPGIWHGFKVLGNEPARLLYYTTNKYSADDPDEERVPWDTFFDWKTEFK